MSAISSEVPSVEGMILRNSFLSNLMSLASFKLVIFVHFSENFTLFAVRTVLSLLLMSYGSL